MRICESSLLIDRIFQNFQIASIVREKLLEWLSLHLPIEGQLTLDFNE